MTTQSLQSSPALQPTIGITGQRVDNRVVSIDVFRGLTMLLMIFVNDLASVNGLPWWTYHMPGHVNGLTYVDMVFPAFLFIVGMSLPIAVNARLNKGASMTELWGHVLLRTVSLLVLGLILANAWNGDPARMMGMNSAGWAVLALTGAFLFWNVYPRSEWFAPLFRVLKFLGLALLILMFAVYRRTTPAGHTAWLDFSYWEILGIIGWTYLSACLLYIPTSRRPWASVAWCALLLLFSVSNAAKWITWPNHLPPYLWPFGSGSLCLIVMAGVVTSDIFLNRDPAKTLTTRVRSAVFFACIALVAAGLLTPLGISKNRATPTWCLYSIGSSVLIFTALYWICDVKKRTSWAAIVRPAGANTLTTYLVPDLYYYAAAAVGVSLFGNFDAGWPGVIRAFVFTSVMLALAALLTRWRIRMQL